MNCSGDHEPRPTVLATIISETADIMARNSERLYSLNPSSRLSVEWRLSERRRIAIERGAIDIPDRDRLAPVISLAERRTGRHPDAVAPLPLDHRQPEVERQPATGLYGEERAALNDEIRRLMAQLVWLEEMNDRGTP